MIFADKLKKNNYGREKNKGGNPKAPSLLKVDPLPNQLEL